MGGIVRIFALTVAFICLAIVACVGSFAIFYSNLPSALRPIAGGVFALVANGYLDEMLYEGGKLDQTLPFAEMKKRSLITQRAKAADKASDFSLLIRVGLPGMEP